MDDEELIPAIVDEPTLLRRPLIVSDRGSIIGFDRSKLEELTDDRPEAVGWGKQR